MKNPERRRQATESGFEQLTFLPEPEFNPQWPNPNTQAAKVLARLLSGERLTLPSYGLHCWRLAAYVMELRNFGWPIQSADPQCPPNARASLKIREYWLDAELIEKIASHDAPSFVRYEWQKHRWDALHQAAAPSERDAAMSRIAKQCGV